jgi:hypothetical protein
VKKIFRAIIALISTAFLSAVLVVPSGAQAEPTVGLNVKVYSYDPGNSPERQPYTLCEGAWTHVDNIDSDFDAQFGGVVAGCQPDFVLVHFTGSVRFPDSGTYAFQALADDGFWLSLDDTPVITNDWVLKGRSGSVYSNISIVGGHAYNLDAWYYEYGGGANVTLTYSPDNGSTWATIPSSFYTSLPGATITSVSPLTGSMAGGTNLTITGTAFASGATVTVGGGTCTNVAFVSATTLTCRTPSGALGAVDVTVRNPDTQQSTKTGAFTYLVPVSNPTIRSVLPSSGASGARDWIDITGTGFVSGSTVTIGGSPCAPNIYLSSKALTCLSPSGLYGSQDIVITNPDTGSVTKVSGFKYLGSDPALKYQTSQSRKFKLSFAAIAKFLKVTQRPMGSLKITVSASSRLVCKVSKTFLQGLKAGTCDFSLKSFDSVGSLVATKTGKFITR